MDVFIDSDLFETSKEVLSDIVSEARNKVDATGRRIVEIRIDGQPVTEDDLPNIDEEGEEAEEVQFITEDPYQMVRTVLLDVRDALEEAKEIHHQVAELLQTDQTTEAMEAFSPALNIWKQTEESIRKSAEFLSLDLTGISVNDKPITEIFTDFADKLKQIFQQYNDGDMFGLSDTLGYEMDEVVDLWSEMLDVLSDHVSTLGEEARQA